MCICCNRCVLLFSLLDAGLLARSQYLEGPATGHLYTDISWLPSVHKENVEMVPKIPRCHYMLLI